MKYLSVCSGIEAASVAWHPLGWKPVGFAEIEPFPSAVLAHHYPTVPNFGDMTQLHDLIEMGICDAPEILVGGTPCQAFSVAGLRKSLDDARGNLSLVYCDLANAIDSRRRGAGLPPAVLVWGNVPGVLSTKDNAFGCFLAGLAGEDEPLVPTGKRWPNAGYVLGPQRAVAWRILDAQYFGLAQRHRRVFVVASARDGFDPATVLFEWDGVRRDTAPSREAREGSAGRAEAGSAVGFQSSQSGVRLVDTHATLDANNGPRRHNGVITMGHGQGGAEIGFDRGPTLTCNHEAPIAAYPATTRTLLGKPNCSHAADKETYVVHTLRGEGVDASEDGTGRGTPLVPVAFSCKDYGADAGEVAPTLRSMGHDKSHANAGGQVAIAFNARQDPDHWHDRTGPLDTDGSTQAVSYAIQAGALRTNPTSGPDGVGVQADHAYTLEARAEVQAVAFAENSRAELRLEGGDGSRCGALSTGGGKPGQGVPMVAVGVDGYNGALTGSVAATMGTRGSSETASGPQVLSNMQVRRLTPTECARLQGFPDDYLDITYRGKPAADGPKYKALGNSMVVPCMRWIGSRIDAHIKGELNSPDEAFL